MSIKRKNSEEIMNYLSSKLLDSNLMKRYGTSLNVNMGRDYQKYLDQKYLQLKQEFDLINKDLDEVITISELKNFINSKASSIGRQYNEEYIEHLFDLVDVDSNKAITLQEFIMAYMLLEEKLRLKNIKLKKLEEDLLLAKDKYLKGLNENKDEKLNEYGVCNSSSVNFTVLEARNLKPMNYDGTCDAYVRIILDNEKVLTTFKPGTLTPIWNEEFSLYAREKNCYIKFEVLNKRNFGGDDVIGSVSINLKDLEDQVKNDKWYYLENVTSNYDNGELRLRIQFIWSKYKYFSDHYNTTEKQIERLHEDFNELNRIIQIFEKPFGLLIYGEINNINDKKLLDRAEEIALYTGSNRKTIFVSPNKGSHKNPNLADRLDNVFRATFRSNIEWSKWSLVLMYSIVILSCINLLDRSDFVNLLIGIFIWIVFIKDHKIDTLSYLRLILIMIVLSLVYDFTWLSLHFKTYLYGTNYDNSEKALKIITYLFSFILFLSKIFFSISLFIQYNRAMMNKNTKSSNYDSNSSNQPVIDSGNNV